MKSTRREFLRSAAFSGAAFAFPSIIPASVLGADAPSGKIAIAQIGCGRIGLTMDVPGFLAAKGAQMVAACDLDSRRLEYMRGVIAKHYSADASSIVAARDFHDLLARKDIDAVSISTPDHWHAQIAVEAAFAGKDVYMQKPASLTIREGRCFADAIKETGRTFLLGSQQRSWGHFHDACAFVREGRIGKVLRIEVGLPGDPAGGSTKEMPVPKCLDYDFWLGSTPKVYYTEDRVHSQKGHLSNKECAIALAENATPELKHVWLCHLSEENNHPELARKTVETILRQHGIIPGVDFGLDILKRKTPSQMYSLT